MSDQPADPPEPERPPANTIGTVAATVAVAALIVVIFARTGGGVGGAFAIVLSPFGMARATTLDSGLGRSIFALLAGIAALLYAIGS